MQYIDRGKAYLHGGKSTSLASNKNGSSKSSMDDYSEVKKRSVHEWKAKDTGDIPCPPEEMGGCGCNSLVLKSMFSQSWVSDLKKKVETIVQTYQPANGDEPQNSQNRCCCFKSDCEADNLRKAATREDSDDNYLYCPSSSDIKQGDLGHFQKHWVMGEPVIVRNVLEFTSGLSWEPMVMWRAFREITYDGSSDLAVKAIDCFDWCEVNCLVYHLFLSSLFVTIISIFYLFNIWHMILLMSSLPLVSMQCLLFCWM